MSADRDRLVEALRQLKPTVLERYRVRGLALFGSVARDAHTAGSDVDILADFDDTADLFDMVGMAEFLGDELARKVDVVPRRSLRPELRDQVLSELVEL